MSYHCNEKGGQCTFANCIGCCTISACVRSVSTTTTAKPPMTNADRIRTMTDEELAEQIYKGISSDPCDYCKHNNLHCDGSPCQGKADVETIIDWLQQPCGGADHA